MAVATYRGGCRLNVLAVKPGMFRTYPRCSAVSRVLRAGENNAACEYATNSAACGYPIVVSAAVSGSIVVVAVGGCHNPGGGVASTVHDNTVVVTDHHRGSGEYHFTTCITQSADRY